MIDPLSHDSTREALLSVEELLKHLDYFSKYNSVTVFQYYPLYLHLFSCIVVQRVISSHNWTS